MMSGSAATHDSESDPSTSSSPSGEAVMRAFLIRAYGNASDVLTLTTTHPQPVLTSAKGVIIAVHAASVNPGDFRISRGDLSLFIKKSFPYVPGFDCAGVVTAIGSKVTRLRVGDAVYGNLATNGESFAEYVLTDESHVALKPNNMTFEQATSMAGAGLSSYQDLHTVAKTQAEQKILILGGSGGTGSIAIQLVKPAGAYVAVTSSTRNLGFIKKQLGADVAIDYTSQDFGTVLKGQDYDIVCDCVGGIDHFEKAKMVLKQGGHFVTLNFDNPDQAMTVFTLLSMAATVMKRKFLS